MNVSRLKILISPFVPWIVMNASLLYPVPIDRLFSSLES